MELPWYVRYENEQRERKERYVAALDALQEMCRRDRCYDHGYYVSEDPQLHRAFAVLVAAGRLEWVGEESLGLSRWAKDKEA